MREPVDDWASDYDVFADDYVRNPAPIWDDLRKRCPVAHTDRSGGSWLLTRYDDVATVARDYERFSSSEPGALSVVDLPDDVQSSRIPPITYAPPEHGAYRQLILPRFAPQVVERMAPLTRARARTLIEGFVDAGRVDASAEYAQQIPVWVIAQLLGVPLDRSDEFTHWAHDNLSAEPDDRRTARRHIEEFLLGQIERARSAPGDDYLGDLVNAEVDGEPLSDGTILAMAELVLIAGIDTTESVLASALWHLAQHEDDRRRLARDRALIPTAIEEFLRSFAPTTVGRLAALDTEVDGARLQAGDRVLVCFPAANRDPEAFEDADRVVIDREVNRHLAFGAGIHRCAGSHLARMELRVALEEWMAAIPEFELEDASSVRWVGGVVRAARSVFVRFPSQLLA